MSKPSKSNAKKAAAYRILTKAEEREILKAQSAKIRKNPKLGIKIAQSAGILDKDGNLTPFYRGK